MSKLYYFTTYVFKKKKKVLSSIYIITYSIAQYVKVSLNFTVFYCTVLYWYIFSICFLFFTTLTLFPKTYVHCNSSCTAEQQVLLCNFITFLWHCSASFLTRRENIPFVWVRNNHWHWPRVQDVTCGLAWPGLCLRPVWRLDGCDPHLLGPVAISGRSFVTSCRDLVSGGGQRWASHRNGQSLASQTLSLDGGPPLAHCPIVWMEFLLLDLELPGLKSKLTCLHSRPRPNVCFYLKVSFHVLGTRGAI